MGIWTGGMALSGLAPGYPSPLASRLTVGAAEGNGPAAVSLLADYYPLIRDITAAQELKPAA